MNATKLPSKTPGQVIDDICARIADRRAGSGAAYTMIVGAGFSYGTVPLTKDILYEHIGDFYYPDQDMTGAERTHWRRQKLSADYWKQFNAAARSAGEPPIEVDRDGLPANPADAYQSLFTYRVANALFSTAPGLPTSRFMARLRAHREAIGAPSAPTRVLSGEKFVKEFLQHVLDPGGYISVSDHLSGKGDYCTTGRNTINGAHFFLASLLELQQSGQLWKPRPFCRTIFTTNFDTLLQDALQLVNLLYSLTDRPERGLAPADFPQDEPLLHLVYTHGSILRHNPASTVDELGVLRDKNLATLKAYLETRDVLVIGYGGWNDSLMSALSACDRKNHCIYWCNVYSAEAAETSLAPAVLDLLRAQAPALEAAIAANCLGIVHVRQGRNDLAIVAYTRSIDTESHCPELRVDALTNRGAAHHQNGDIELAMADFSRAVAIWEDHTPAVGNAIAARALIYRGIAHRQNGGAQRVEDDFRRALALKGVPPEYAALIERPPA